MIISNERNRDGRRKWISPQKRQSFVRRRKDFPPPTPQPTPCRLWQGVTTDYGYGRRANGQAVHRWVMETVIGRKLTSNEVVMHLCDQPLCYRFEHLRLATRLENNRDMMSKGRDRLIGSKNSQAKLTEDDVTQIRHRVTSGERREDVAADYRVKRQAIDGIVNGKTWKHV